MVNIHRVCFWFEFVSEVSKNCKIENQKQLSSTRESRDISFLLVMSKATRKWQKAKLKYTDCWNRRRDAAEFCLTTDNRCVYVQLPPGRLFVHAKKDTDTVYQTTCRYQAVTWQQNSRRIRLNTLFKIQGKTIVERCETSKAGLLQCHWDTNHFYSCFELVFIFYFKFSAILLFFIYISI